MNQTAISKNLDISERVDEAFAHAPRAHFLPEAYQTIAQVNSPVPIGFDQTNSQPSTVYKMIKWLEPHPGHHVLDIGSGSGWTSAILSYLVGQKGFVHAVERIPALLEFGQANCQKLGIPNISFHRAGSTLGYSKKAPYDRILVSASAKELPKELIDQLTIGGKMIIPINNSIVILKKTGPDSYFTIEEPGFGFVPLVKD